MLWKSSGSSWQLDSSVRRQASLATTVWTKGPEVTPDVLRATALAPGGDTGCRNHSPACSVVVEALARGRGTQRSTCPRPETQRRRPAHSLTRYQRTVQHSTAQNPARHHEAARRGSQRPALTACYVRRALGPSPFAALGRVTVGPVRSLGLPGPAWPCPALPGSSPASCRHTLVGIDPLQCRRLARPPRPSLSRRARAVCRARGRGTDRAAVTPLHRRLPSR